MDHREEFLDAFSKGTVGRDLLSMLIGERLGEGCHREVYAHATDKSLVVKVERHAKSFCNVYEHDIWECADYTDVKEWLAPVVDISPCGSVLLMRRTKPVLMREMPEKVPAFLTDLKLANWGWYKGRIVCHDYANGFSTERGMRGRFKKAKWWE